MYHDLKQHFWWSGMKGDVATFESRCLIYQQVKIEHQRASGLKSGMIAGIKVEEEIIRDMERLDIELYVRRQHGYWTEFRLDEDDVLWKGTRLCVPKDATLREAPLTEAHSSPFSVHPGSPKMYHDLK
uniref:Retrotransposon protein, putative, Ty3-gypsy subclass n=1 Tax=Tanacetum cinerariifolium TaxID=118510 RepID=A0A699TCB2_TANCI|nr:retrotransposon protein, putative, Ty3-gypsy subclass [Tanacetum cinerariifolium]